jgi:hypothetical protein
LARYQRWTTTMHGLQGRKSEPLIERGKHKALRVFIQSAKFAIRHITSQNQIRRIQIVAGEYPAVGPANGNDFYVDIRQERSRSDDGAKFLFELRLPTAST